MSEFRVVEANGHPLTRAQIAEKTGIPGNSIRPRCLEAIDGGWIQQSSSTPSVADNEVLELTAKARTCLMFDRARTVTNEGGQDG